MRVRWLVVAAGALLVLTALAPMYHAPKAAASAEDNRSAEIRAVLARQQDAWNRVDINTFMQGYWHSPDLTFAGSSGITRGWTPVLERYRERYRDAQAMGHLDFSDLEIRSLGTDVALVLGRWHLKRAHDEPAGVFTLIFRRFPEGWRIIHDHTSASESK